MARLSAGTSAFSIIRTAAWYTPLAPLRGAVPAPTGRTGQRSAFPCLRVAPLGGMGARGRRRRSARGVRRTAQRRNATCENRGDGLGTPTSGRHARERETSADDGAPYRREWRTRCSIGTVLFAALRAAVPTRGRRSLACVSLVRNQDCAARPAARGGADQRSAFPCLRVACAQSGLRRSPRCAGRYGVAPTPSGLSTEARTW